MAKNTTKVNKIVTIDMLTGGELWDSEDFVASCTAMWDKALGILDTAEFARIREKAEITKDGFMAIYAINAAKNICWKTKEAHAKPVEKRYNDEKPRTLFGSLWAYRDRAAATIIYNAFGLSQPPFESVAWMFERVTKEDKTTDADGLNQGERDRILASARDAIERDVKRNVLDPVTAGLEITEDRYYEEAKKNYLDEQAYLKHNDESIVDFAFSASVPEAEADVKEIYDYYRERGWATGISLAERVMELFYGYPKNGKRIKGAFDRIIDPVADCKELAKTMHSYARAESQQIHWQEILDNIAWFERDHTGNLEESGTQAYIANLRSIWAKRGNKH